MNKGTRLIKRLVALFLVLLLSIESFAAVVSDNDGSAFITKAEFDSLKNNFQAQIDQYNTSIDSKIDGAIASYLAGITVEKNSNIDNTLYKIWNSNSIQFKYTTFDSRQDASKITVQGGVSGFKFPGKGSSWAVWRTFVINQSVTHYNTDGKNLVWYYEEVNGKRYLIGSANDRVDSLLVLSGSQCGSENGDGKVTFGNTVSITGYTGSTIPTYTASALSTSVDDVSNTNYATCAPSGWSYHYIRYSLIKTYSGGTLSDFRIIVPAGNINSSVAASDFTKRGSRDWEYWTKHSVSYDLSPLATANSMTFTLTDDIPVFKIKSISFNVNTTNSYLAHSIGVEIPWYGGLPLCTAVYNGTCAFNVKVDKACYLTIKDNEPCKNTTAQADPGVEITKNSETTSAKYIELAANTSTKLTFPSAIGHMYYIKLTPKTTTDTVKITALDDTILNQGN